MHLRISDLKAAITYKIKVFLTQSKSILSDLVHVECLTRVGVGSIEGCLFRYRSLLGYSRRGREAARRRNSTQMIFSPLLS